VQDDAGADAFGDTFRITLSDVTLRIQEFITLSKEYESAISRRLGINATDTAALGELMMNGPMSPTDLARRLQISTAAVTTVVDRLNAADHVTREPHPTDRRGVLIVLTPETVRRAMRTLMPVASAINSTLDEFDESERAVIGRYLDLVVERQREALLAEQQDLAPR
jgi:DNA-binding MarR family transcriptional regulator